MGNLKTGYRLRPVRIVTTTGSTSVPGYPSAVKGLALTQDFDLDAQGQPREARTAHTGRGGSWSVCHINSGRRLNPAQWLLTRGEALELVERLGEFSTDWDQCKDYAALQRWAPALVEYFDNFAEEHGLKHTNGKPNPAFPHEQSEPSVDQQEEDAVVARTELATEVAAEEEQEAEAEAPLQFHCSEAGCPGTHASMNEYCALERYVENAPAFTGEEDDDGSGRPAAPPGWEWKEPGFDSYLICPCGDEIEQDGKCPAGHVSFLRQWGFI